MRFFIALDIPEDSKAQLRQVQESIKALIPEARLTANNKLHITIAFIGEEPNEQQSNLEQIIKEAVADIPFIELIPAYLDGFPSIHHPHTLWAGVKGDIDKLLIITDRIRDGLHKLNLQVDERRFVPHIAIAKFANYHTPEVIEKNLQTMIFGDFLPIHITSIKLYESLTDGGFHKHNTLAEIPLQS